MFTVTDCLASWRTFYWILTNYSICMTCIFSAVYSPKIMQGNVDFLAFICLKIKER